MEPESWHERLSRDDVVRTPTMRKVHVYEDPETSAVSGEFTTLREALGFRCRPKAEIIRNGTVLAYERGGSWALTTVGSTLVL